jgi:hypothetical protein
MALSLECINKFSFNMEEWGRGIFLWAIAHSYSTYLYIIYVVNFVKQQIFVVLY